MKRIIINRKEGTYSTHFCCGGYKKKVLTKGRKMYGKKGERKVGKIYVLLGKKCNKRRDILK